MKYTLSVFTICTLNACSIGMPNNVAIGIGGGNHTFGIGTSINFPISTKPVRTEPLPIAGTEKPAEQQTKTKH